MEPILSDRIIVDDLIHTFQRFFRSNVLECRPIKRGWLNLKWQITTDEGQFLLKQYNKERFRKYHPDEVRLALSQQDRLYGSGLICPKLLSHNDNILLESDNGEQFIVMEYCQGALIAPGKANADQLYDLGRATGIMHRLLNDGTLGNNNEPQFIPPSRAERLSHWDAVLEQSKVSNKPELLASIEIQRKATEDMNVEIFESLQSGWAHRDLWVDNLLFDDNRLTAILDFDRLKYDYPMMDVARAVMSCAFDEKLDVSLASALIKGYSEHQKVSDGFLTNSLQLLWYMESIWWIDSSMDQHSVPPARFAKEMMWLAENLNNLTDMLGDL